MADVKISNLPASTVPLAGTEVLPIVQSGVTKKVATDDLTVKNVRSNATNGILQVVGPAAAATRVMTTPDANFTVARTDAGQTFTGVNTFTSPKIITDISDTNGNELLKITATASAVNEITVANAATGNNPVLSATGSNTDIGITLTPKGTGNVVLTTGNLVVANGNGIDFSATANTGTSELLNDYEEGTWTPTVFGSTTAGTATYSEQSGKYIKIGGEVTVIAAITYTAADGTGVLRVNGLPYAIANNGVFANFGLEYSNLTVPANAIAQIVARPNTSFLQIDSIVTGGAGQSGLAVDAAATLFFSVTYFV
jgi:hypothetical protein